MRFGENLGLAHCGQITSLGERISNFVVVAVVLVSLVSVQHAKMRARGERPTWGRRRKAGTVERIFDQSIDSRLL